jgi:adenylosuccinate lyase
MEMIAVELRHLQRTEVGEVQEGFKPGQKGSSAMPHKRNPISAETISGLSRVLRGNLQAGMQDVALWHERDISHSSVERIVLPDSSLMAYYVMRRMQRLLAGLQIFPDRMRANLDASFGLVFSQPVLLALVHGGLGRDEAYRVVQDNAARAWSERRSFRELLDADPRVNVSSTLLDEAFDLRRSLRHSGAVFDGLVGL